jgi:hypothetical protein
MPKSLKPCPFSDHSLPSSPLIPNLTQRIRWPNGFRSLSGRSETGRGSAILAENFSGVRWFSEAEILAVFIQADESKCSYSKSATVPNSGRRGVHTSESKLTKAFELVTGGKPSSHSPKKANLR